MSQNRDQSLILLVTTWGPEFDTVVMIKEPEFDTAVMIKEPEFDTAVTT